MFHLCSNSILDYTEPQSIYTGITLYIIAIKKEKEGYQLKGVKIHYQLTQINWMYSLSEQYGWGSKVTYW